MVGKSPTAFASLLLTINQKVNNLLKRLSRLVFVWLKATDVWLAGGNRGVPSPCLFYGPNGALSFLLLLCLIRSRLQPYQSPLFCFGTERKCIMNTNGFLALLNVIHVFI